MLIFNVFFTYYYFIIIETTWNSFKLLGTTWNSLKLIYLFKTLKILQVTFEKSVTNELTDGLTTYWVTTSLLELLIAAKDTIYFINNVTHWKESILGYMFFSCSAPTTHWWHKHWNKNEEELLEMGKKWLELCMFKGIS